MIRVVWLAKSRHALCFTARNCMPTIWSQRVQVLPSTVKSVIDLLCSIGFKDINELVHVSNRVGSKTRLEVAKKGENLKSFGVRPSSRFRVWDLGLVIMNWMLRVCDLGLWVCSYIIRFRA